MRSAAMHPGETGSGGIAARATAARRTASPGPPAGRALIAAVRRGRIAFAAALLALIALVAASAPALALKPISLTGDQDWIEISALGESYEGRGDTLQIEMAPSADGATARMAVRASIQGSSPNWIVFALHNPTNKAVEMWLTADRYSPIGAGIVWPDLDTRRIAAVAHSAGFAPERVRNDRIDIYRLTVERGQTITYVVELASERFPRVDLWKPVEFEQRQRERQLFNGIMLGITGLLAVFLTAVFAANHKSIFPMAGLVAWCALALLCVDFGFWHKLFQMKPEDNAQYRAAAEAALAASLVIFLAAFLRVNLWSGFARTLFVVWIAGQLAIVAVAVLDPRLAATVARLSLGMIGGLGFLLILGLSLRGLDRALALMPTWILFLVWLFGAAVTLTGRMGGEFAISGIVAGLVLILLLIGFTVTQYAFRSTEPLLAIGPGGQQLRLAAMDRAGVAFWEWNIRRDELRLDAEIEALLGLAPGELPSPVDDFLAYVHPADRERFRLELLAIRERGGGTLRTGIRLRHADSSYRWLDFEGASVPTTDIRNLRCVGLVRDATDQKRAQERLLNNAVYDSLTSLPNRELFLDRLSGVMRPAAAGAPPRDVAVFMVDIDRFRAVNASFGIVVGDSIILTVSRRLARLLGPGGSLARVGGDQFAMFLVDQSDPRDLAGFAERLRLSLGSPIRIAGQEIVLTRSIGVAIHDGTAETGRELMRDAEIAMHRAKRSGSDRTEIFSPEMHGDRAERTQLERDLATALEERRLTLLYQPIVSLANDELIGFEAVIRWQHPRLGTLSPLELLPIAERADLVGRLASFSFGRVTADIARWQQELPRPETPLFVTLSLPSRQLLAPELVQEIRHARTRTALPAGSLKLSITESLVMDNPEQASHALELLRDAGIELWMDRFGTGYSSLAYLGRFPFDAFRIDKALVEWSSQGQGDAALVRSIVAVAHELGKKVVGDGIATAEDAMFLRSIGCHYAQGFHYGDAMGDDELLRLLRLIRKSERRMRRRGMVRGQEKKRQAEAAPEITLAPTTPEPAPATAAQKPAALQPRPQHEARAQAAQAAGPSGLQSPAAPAPGSQPPRNQPMAPAAQAAVTSSTRPGIPAGPGPAGPAGVPAAAHAAATPIPMSQAPPAQTPSLAANGASMPNRGAPMHSDAMPAARAAPPPGGARPVVPDHVAPVVARLDAQGVAQSYSKPHSAPSPAAMPQAAAARPAPAPAAGGDAHHRTPASAPAAQPPASPGSSWPASASTAGSPPVTPLPTAAPQPANRLAPQPGSPSAQPSAHQPAPQSAPQSAAQPAVNGKEPHVDTAALAASIASAAAEVRRTETPTVPTRPTSRRQPAGTLSPAVAASLARLAGKTDPSASPSRDAKPDPDALPPAKDAKAAG